MPVIVGPASAAPAAAGLSAAAAATAASVPAIVMSGPGPGPGPGPTPSSDATSSTAAAAAAVAPASSLRALHLNRCPSAHVQLWHCLPQYLASPGLGKLSRALLPFSAQRIGTLAHTTARVVLATSVAQDYARPVLDFEWKEFVDEPGCSGAALGMTLAGAGGTVDAAGVGTGV